MLTVVWVMVLGLPLRIRYISFAFCLAAVMYVDDTDLLHWAPEATTTDSELIEYVQVAGGELENGADFGLFVYPLGITEMRRQESWRTFGASQYCVVPV